MLSLRYLLRSRCLQSPVFKLRLSTTSSQNSDRKESDDTSVIKAETKENNESKEDNSKKNQALNKLNSLLTTMVGEEYVSSTSKALNNQLARPKQRAREAKEKEEKSKDPEPLATAAKKVAESFGGNVKQTESELLTKLRSTDENTKKSMNLNELIVGMKIDRERKPPVAEGRASQVRRILDKRGGGDRERRDGDRDWRDGDRDWRDGDRERRDGGRERRDARRSGEEGMGRDGEGSYEERGRERRPDERRQHMPPIRVKLFDHERLGIFTASDDVATTTPPELATWRSLHERELRLAVTHPPANIFEEMILWTEHGKLWKFPIDNEQGLEEESQVYFADHVFLEPQLEPWCPKRGPVRHFMELVCVGLSKNPYLTVREKREHIEWFRDYFKEKQDILVETGAMDVSSVSPRTET